MHHLTWYSAHVGAILTGPVFALLGVIYAATDTRNSPDLIYCNNLQWELNWDVREQCQVDIAERVRCPLPVGVSSPPTMDAVLYSWAHAGVLVLGTGCMHTFSALSIAFGPGESGPTHIPLLCYASAVAFFGFIGTIATSGIAMVATHTGFSCVLILCSYTIAYEVSHDAEVTTAQCNWSRILLSASMLTLLSTALALALAPQGDANQQMVASTLLAAAQILYLNIWSAQVLIALRRRLT
jgi:hypothetical protein